MKAVLILSGSLLLAHVMLAQTALAKEPDPANGQKLFAASQCMSCHGTDVFTRPDRKITSRAALESKVRSCDAGLSTNWFDDEIVDVVAYLNQTYYKFT
jgi:mono/diheme cytochrome c family protein